MTSNSQASVQLKNGCIVIDDQSQQLISGSVHYWRLDPCLWKRILQQCKLLGFDTICSYVPWSVHETARGQFDFHGPRNLPRFLDLAAELELKVLLRPGPHINAEITGFGFPNRILQDPEIKARGPNGEAATMPAPPQAFHIPSYSSSKFFSEVALFFDALSPIFEEYCFPKGPVIAVQADNENSYFFRTGPYDLDYHPEAIERYRSFVAEKYPSLSALAEVYPQTVRSFDELEPPTEPFAGETLAKKEMKWRIDWQQFKEQEIRRGLQQITELLRVRLPDPKPLLFHNYPPSDLLQSPFNVHEAEEFLDFQGIDVYPARSQARYLKRQCLTLSGCSRLPSIPEFGAGSSPWNSIVRLRDQRFTAPYCVMNGIRALNFYMLVERERWYGSPILVDGRIRPDHQEFFEQFNSLVNTIDLANCRLEASVAVMVPRIYQRFWHSAYLLDPIPPILFALAEQDTRISVLESDFGFSEAIAIEYPKRLESILDLLSSQNIPFRIVEDSSELSEEQRKVVVCPCFDLFDQKLLKKLRAWSESGSTIILTPGTASIDEDLQQIKNSLDHFQIAGSFNDSLEQQLEAQRPGGFEALTPLEVLTQENIATGQRFLFIANCQDHEQSVPCPAALDLDPKKKIYGTAKISAEQLIVEAYSVSVFEIPR